MPEIQGPQNFTGPVTFLSNVDLKGASAVRVTKNDSQTMTGGTYDKVEYDDVAFDVLGEFDSSNYRFVATHSGYYLAFAIITTASVAWSATHYLSLAFYKNGSIDAGVGHLRVDASVTTVKFIWGSALVYLDAGDYLEVYVNIGRGVDTNTATGTDANWQRFEIVRIA